MLNKTLLEIIKRVEYEHNCIHCGTEMDEIGLRLHFRKRDKYGTKVGLFIDKDMMNNERYLRDHYLK